MNIATAGRDAASALEYFASLLSYPERDTAGLRTDASELIGHLEALGPGAQSAAAGVRAFLDRISALGRETLEETYTATFELNPVSYLYAGYVLLGESYKRGAFMVELKSKLSRYGVECGSELPDFIPVLLRLLARLPEGSDEVAELQSLCLHPALQKIADGVKNHDNPYFSLLVGARDFLTGDREQPSKENL